MMEIARNWPLGSGLSRHDDGPLRQKSAGGSGDLSETALLRDAIRGSDAVLSALGPSSVPHPKDLPITRAIEAIIAAMRQEDITRLIAVTTGTAVDQGDGSDWEIWLPTLAIRYATRSTHDDIIGLAKAIRNSNLDWTMVRIAILKSDPAFRRINIGLYGHTKHSWTVNREDLAIFKLDQISHGDFVHQAPGIGSRKI
ncbi:NAD(P)H-binding protein [Rhizobium jaguaris]|uniref:NAD(P)-dependent oxidoreductase n=1 Tax=Rhizobium jaguaris TaxID=1312183 RepID=UPI0039BF2CCC